ncbi:MAG TPA: NAD-dependent epimerase/dehydratase family protein [Streptosporangiaceae bacterium]|nr:NAD-dependent epimerase/dehydratase family protein [Streptosporangiaceae bacterium]
MGELVLVTGGSDYIGGWCVAELLRRGYQVRTTVRSPGREQDVTEAVSATVSAAGDPAGRLSFAVADLTSDDGWDAAVKGADHVLHVASPLGLSPRGAPRTELVTVLPGAVFSPILTTSNIGSVGIAGRVISGKMRGSPRIGLEIVDIRDLADVHH